MAVAAGIRAALGLKEAPHVRYMYLGATLSWPFSERGFGLFFRGPGLALLPGAGWRGASGAAPVPAGRAGLDRGQVSLGPATQRAPLPVPSEPSYPAVGGPCVLIGAPAARIAHPARKPGTRLDRDPHISAYA
jgi:hypothetical protein